MFNVENKPVYVLDDFLCMDDFVWMANEFSRSAFCDVEYGNNVIKNVSQCSFENLSSYLSGVVSVDSVEKKHEFLKLGLPGDSYTNKHNDSEVSDWAILLFLCGGIEYQHGTTFYDSNGFPYSVEAKPNRAIVFDTSITHCQSGENMGDLITGGRATYSCFFNVTRSIFLAKPFHLPTISLMIEKFWSIRPCVGTPSPRYFVRYWKEMIETESGFIVVCTNDKGEMCGVSGYLIQRNQCTGMDEAVEAFLFADGEKYRDGSRPGKKVSFMSSDLVSRAETEAIARGCSNIYLSAFEDTDKIDSRFKATKRMFKSMGYKPLETHFFKTLGES